MMLHQRTATLHPVTAIAIDDVIEPCDFRTVDMPAHDPVDIQPRRLERDGRFEITDELDRVLDLMFQVSRKRPVGQFQPSPHAMDDGIHLEERVVQPTAQHRDGLGTADHAIELISVCDKQPAAIGIRMDDVLHDMHVAKRHVVEVSQDSSWLPGT